MCRRNTSTPTQRAEMTPTPKWIPAARVLADFISRMNALPRQSGATDPEEIRAGNALRTFRRMRVGGTLDAELGAWLDANAPGWGDENTRPAARGMRGSRSFEAKALAAKRFIAAHGRFPSSASDNQQEAVLGVFLRNCRQASKGKGTVSWTASKRLRLDRMVPGWGERLNTVNG